ncbi:MAG: hypothetical protein FD131_4161, partial [Rhodocyclaceae bacterium]
MKTAEQMFDEYSGSPEEFKRATQRIKRVQGGLRNEASVKAHSLDAKETKALVAAADILSTLASRYEKLEVLAKRKRAEKEKIQKAIRTAMAGNFQGLSSLQDKVALIGAADSHWLRDNKVQNMRDVDYYFQESLTSLMWRLQGQVTAA